MEAELNALEQKLNQMVELCQRLRTDNLELRQQLATAADRTRRLEEKIDSATSRLEGLLSQIPAEDDA